MKTRPCDQNIISTKEHFPCFKIRYLCCMTLLDCFQWKSQDFIWQIDLSWPESLWDPGSLNFIFAARSWWHFGRFGPNKQVFYISSCLRLSHFSDMRALVHPLIIICCVIFFRENITKKYYKCVILNILYTQSRNFIIPAIHTVVMPIATPTASPMQPPIFL